MPYTIQYWYWQFRAKAKPQLAAAAAVFAGRTQGRILIFLYVICKYLKSSVSLYTILSLPIEYGIWYIQEDGEFVYSANVGQWYCSSVGNADELG